MKHGGFAVTTVLLAGVTLLGLWFDKPPAANLILAYLLVVVFTASRWGAPPAVFAALLSVLAYDMFFVPPYGWLTFSAGDAEHFLTFVGFLSVGLLVAHWTSRMKSLAAREHESELLREKERLQEALLNSVSHDLQSPIASIAGAIEGLCDPEVALDEEGRNSLLDTARTETHRLQRYVRNLLDVTRLESGLSPRLADCDLTDLFGTALNQLEEPLQGRRVEVELDPLGPQSIKVDFVLFNQVLVNLIDNACKYSEAGSPILLRGEMSEGHTCVEVCDRGTGVEDADRERIFEKFFRRSDTRTSGSGLGLAISRGLVEAHGGVLNAWPRVGGGTVMRIVLP